MKPLPIISTPTRESRQTFLRAMQVAGIGWCGGKISAAHINDEDLDDSYLYAYLDPSYELMSIVFAEGDGHGLSMIESGKCTLMNSPRHFVQYAAQFKRAVKADEMPF